MQDHNTVVVIGNGESRSKINLTLLSSITTIGCNAIFRDIKVDHLVCCDRRMVEESLEYSETSTYTRDSYYHDFRKLKKLKHINKLPTLPYVGLEKKDQSDHWGSGPYAVLLACNLNFKTIFIIGFDLYGDDSKVNNMYKGTKNYSSKDSSAVDPSYWIYQIKKMLQIYKNLNFIVVNKEDWKMPREWKLPNVKFMTTEKFIDIVATDLNIAYN
jgi:hypothetical protein